jgi:hypothetical protein
VRKDHIFADNSLPPSHYLLLLLCMFAYRAANIGLCMSHCRSSLRADHFTTERNCLHPPAKRAPAVQWSDDVCMWSWVRVPQGALHYIQACFCCRCAVVSGTGLCGYRAIGPSKWTPVTLSLCYNAISIEVLFCCLVYIRHVVILGPRVMYK